MELALDLHISINVHGHSNKLGLMNNTATSETSICGNAHYTHRKPELDFADCRCKRRRQHRWLLDDCSYDACTAAHSGDVNFDAVDSNRRTYQSHTHIMHGEGNIDKVCPPAPLSSSLWSNLPSELIERILACLPMASLFKFRAVCHSWNAAPSRPLFKTLRAHTMIPESWLILLAALPAERRTSSPFAFKLEENKAVALPHTFLPFPIDPGSFSFCTAAGGLICYHRHMGFGANYEGKSVSLWVGNPFTKEWKCLPPMIGSFPLNFPLRGLVGMVVLDSNNDSTRAKQPVHYKIIVRTGSQSHWGSGMMTEEYDSQTNLWRVTTMGNVPLDHRIEQVVHCNGSLYFLTWQARNGIYAYHMATQEWTHILPPKRYQFTSPHMVECCGHLVLVSGVGRHHTTKLGGVRQLHIRTTGIKLWQFIEEDSVCANAFTGTESAPRSSFWSSLSHMPEELVREFVTGAQFHCTSIQNLIYLTNSISMLIFDVVGRMWRRVIITQLPCSVQDFVSFVPKLEASP